ncbi:MAG: ATP synthase F1 subunit delta [Caulobacterales bacterium]|jgi:F-type H+-transporting ATPase subunit delta
MAAGRPHEQRTGKTNVSEHIDRESSQAAGRYAQAAFELGLEQNALDALAKDFTVLAQAFAESADLRAAAASPLIEPAEKARALVAVAKKLGVSALGVNLVGVVTQNRRAAELPGIAQAFAKLLTRHRGESQVEIISAKPLTAAEESEITTAVGKALGSTISATKRVDESLIGGFIVRAGSRQFDASIRAKLDGLKLALKSA